MKLGIIPDFHLREKLSYDEFIKGGRQQEEQDILDFVVDSFKNVDKIIFMGDIFNSRSPSSTVIRKFINFIERLDKKELYVIAGNHDQLYSCTKSSLDFIKEIKSKDWHIITNEIVKEGDFTFMPYFTRQFLDVGTHEEATDILMKKLKPNKILFTHHSISGTSTSSGIETNVFDEIVLPKKELEKKFKLIVGGHIHQPSIKNNTIVAGSLMTSTVGELQKYIWKIDAATLKYEQIKLPGRAIYKLTDPTDKDLKIDKSSIVKVILTKKLSAVKIGELKEKLKKFDAYILLEKIPRHREKLHYGGDEGLLEFPLEKLLELYAKERKIDINKLKMGFELIR